MRPGHPAQRAAARAAKAAAGGKAVPAGNAVPAGKPVPTGRPVAGRTAAPGAPRTRPAPAPQDRGPERRERRDDALEMVAGRNPVVESLRASVPAMALYVTGRAQERTGRRVGATGRGRGHRRAGDQHVRASTGLPTTPFTRASPSASARTSTPTPTISWRAVTARSPAHRRSRRGDRPPEPGCHRPVRGRVRRVRGRGPARRSAHVTAGAWKASAGALSVFPSRSAPT